MKNLFLAALVLFGSLAGSVANADPVDHREHRQETRIDQGQQDGSLTRGESRRLERQQRRIERQERRDLLRAHVAKEDAMLLAVAAVLRS